MICPDESCKGELRKHPEAFMSNPPMYIYGCLKCKAKFKQRGECGDLALYWNQEPMDWEYVDKIYGVKKKDSE